MTGLDVQNKKCLEIKLEICVKHLRNEPMNNSKKINTLTQMGFVPQNKLKTNKLKRNGFKKNQLKTKKLKRNKSKTNKLKKSKLKRNKLKTNKLQTLTQMGFIKMKKKKKITHFFGKKKFVN